MASRFYLPCQLRLISSEYLLCWVEKASVAESSVGSVAARLASRR